MFLQISILQLATGEAGILLWCQELQAGDFEQLNVHLAESLVFSNPNVAVQREESPPSSQRFPQSVVLIHSGYQFSFCPLAPNPPGGMGNEHNLMEPCCSHSMLVLPPHSLGRQLRFYGVILIWKTIISSHPARERRVHAINNSGFLSHFLSGADRQPKTARKLQPWASTLVKGFTPSLESLN